MRIIEAPYLMRSMRTLSDGEAIEGGPPQPYPNARSGLASRPRTVATRHGHYVHVD
jgi:hypothetical protein